VSGAAALLLSYDDSYTVDNIEDILKGTALPLTDEDHAEVPNNAYGHGLVDIFNAVSSTEKGLGTVKGKVTDEHGDVIDYQGTVTVKETNRTIQTQKDGSFTLADPVGDVTLQVEAYGHHPNEQDVSIAKDETVNVEFGLKEIDKGVLTGKVTDEKTGKQIANATLSLKEDPNVEPVKTDGNGTYELEGYVDAYTLVVTAPGYKDNEIDVD